MPEFFLEPPRNCGRCPRLERFRRDNRQRFPEFHNAPVPSFGPQEAAILIVGLAPGLKGANRTGRPFTGDYAGNLLYPTLLKFGLAEGRYGQSPDDGLVLRGCRITNAARCVPPENKPTTEEVRACRDFLRSEIAAMPCLRAIIALGGVSHGSVLTACSEVKARYRFAHGAQHALPNGLILADSYHCSRYNTNTGRLTTEMFESVFAGLLARLG
ncbi:MAG: uracil-DNA glycosylase [Rhodovibrionaceae bacterium]